MRMIVFILLCALFVPSLAEARGLKAKYGTGFFVTRNGHIVTNEHVVRGCKRAFLRGAMKGEAELVHVDAGLDLAILKSRELPRHHAALAEMGDPQTVGQELMVLGYPAKHRNSGTYKVEYSEILGMHGPRGEAHLMQFKDSALQGNSGGPLLDASGNVVGVVMGKATARMTNPSTGEEIVQRTDIGVQLDALKRYLLDNGVYYKKGVSRDYYSIEKVEKRAKKFVVNIQCLLEDLPDGATINY